MARLLHYYAGVVGLLRVSGYEIVCPESNKGPWVTPGTTCRSYYTCVEGTPMTHYCPPNTFFNSNTERCGGSGSCYELICSGREDGQYPDPTEDCTRSFWCYGGRLERVGPPLSVGACPPLPGAAARVIHQPNRCSDKPDGRYVWDDSCSGYYECRSEIETDVINCPINQKFDGWSCKEGVTHCNSICSGKPDGSFSDPNTQCRQYVKCINGRLITRNTCPAETAFNGNLCTPRGTFFCPGIDHCSSLPNGYHLKSCENYFQCEWGLTKLVAECPQNEYFNGISCTAAKNLSCDPPYISNKCLGKDGFYTNHTSGCEAYYYCNRDGTKINFTCPPGQLFNGTVCVTSDAFSCPILKNTCEDKSEGYYPLRGSLCQIYYYCFNGNKITYLCPKGLLYNGNTCVPPSNFTCPDDLLCNELNTPCT